MTQHTQRTKNSTTPPSPDAVTKPYRKYIPYGHDENYKPSIPEPLKVTPPRPKAVLTIRVTPQIRDKINNVVAYLRHTNGAHYSQNIFVNDLLSDILEHFNQDGTPIVSLDDNY